MDTLPWKRVQVWDIHISSGQISMQPEEKIVGAVNPGSGLSI